MDKVLTFVVAVNMVINIGIFLIVVELLDRIEALELDVRELRRGAK